MAISFRYDRERALHATLWLLHKHGGAMDKLKLVKLIFYADREHLAKYGRPVVGGHYVAMQHGPVPSQLLDELNAALDTPDSPIQVSGITVRANAPASEDVLSESDLEVLEHVNTDYGRRDTSAVRNLTHSLEAWRKNYPDPQENTSRPMPYEDFFLDLDDKEMLEIIQDQQAAMDF